MLSVQKNLRRSLEDENLTEHFCKDDQTVVCESLKEDQTSRTSDEPCHISSLQSDLSEHKENDKTLSNIDSITEHTQQVSTPPEAGDSQRFHDNGEVKVAEWITSPPISKLQVEFTTKAERRLSAFHSSTSKGKCTCMCLLPKLISKSIA